MTKVFGYSRVSGQSQVDADGFVRQELAIRALCAEKQLELVAIYREEAVSGTVDGMHRPKWVEMLLQMEKDGVNTIVIEGVDRLARALMVSEYIISDLERMGITLLSSREPDLCASDPTRVLFRHIMAAIAQYDKNMIVLKLKAARQRKKVATGRCEGRKPYGYYVDEVDKLSAMRHMKSMGADFSTIAFRMNGAGMSPRINSYWSERMVKRILSREL